MLPPPKYTRTPAEGSCYQHHNTIIDDNDNDGDSAPPPAYTRRPNQAPSTQDNAQLTAEESNSHSTLPSPTPNLDIARPQQAFSPGSSRRNDFADDVRAWHTFQDWHTSAGARFNIEVFHTAPRYGYGIHGGHHAAVDFHGRPLRRRPRQRGEFCLSCALFGGERGKLP